MPTAE